MTDCIFCKIIEGKIPSIKVFENEKIIAFLDISPVNPGHVLVMPKKHFKNIFDVPEDLLCETVKISKKIASSLIKAKLAQGINIGINNELAAGQLVMHLHVHVMPRLENDGFKHWQGKAYPKDQAEKIADEIRKAL